MPFKETEVAAFYDRIAASDQFMVKDPGFWRDEFNQLNLDRPIFFDFGCGDGREVRLYREVFGNMDRYYGLDLSAGMLRHIHSFAPEAKLVQASFNHLPFADNVLPAVWAAASYLHLDQDQIQPALTELYRCMKPDARGFISLKGHPHEPIADYNKHLARRYDLSEFARLLKGAGFTVTHKFSDPNRDSRGVTWLGFFFTKPRAKITEDENARKH